MKWSGRCTEGAGLSTGETTEIANSYLSRFGQVTRVMESTGMWYVCVNYYTHNCGTVINHNEYDNKYIASLLL